MISTYTTGTASVPLSQPRSILFDAAKNLYVTCSGSGLLVRISNVGKLEAVVTDMQSPGGIALEANGNILVADTGHHMVARVTPGGDPSLVAGLFESGRGTAGYCGDRGPGD